MTLFLVEVLESFDLHRFGSASEPGRRKSEGIVVPSLLHNKVQVCRGKVSRGLEDGFRFGRGFPKSGSIYGQCSNWGDQVFLTHTHVYRETNLLRSESPSMVVFPNDPSPTYPHYRTRWEGESWGGSVSQLTSSYVEDHLRCPGSRSGTRRRDGSTWARVSVES